MKLVLKCTALMLAALLAGCTEEVQNGEGNLPKPDDTDSGGRREVLLTKEQASLERCFHQSGNTDCNHGRE